jgi:hypothetical protein
LAASLTKNLPVSKQQPRSFLRSGSDYDLSGYNLRAILPRKIPYHNF